MRYQRSFSHTTGSYSKSVPKQKRFERSFQILFFSFENTLLLFRCIELDYPLLAEYDFKNDAVNPDLKYVSRVVITLFRWLCTCLDVVTSTRKSLKFPLCLFFLSLLWMSQWGKSFDLLFSHSIDLKPTTVLRPYQVGLRLLVCDSCAKEILLVK